MHDDFPEMRIYLHSASPIFSNGRPGRKESNKNKNIDLSFKF